MNKNFKSGFTLIEIMIAITLFTLVMIIGTGAVLQTNAVYKKTQTIRSVMDNLNFVMEDMSRNLRLGSSFHCFATGEAVAGLTEDPKDCPNGSPIISFEGLNGASGDVSDQILYAIQPNQANSSIYSLYKSTDGGSTFTPITPDEVSINFSQSGFTVTGSPAGDGIQPLVVIRLSGTITYKNSPTDFNLETTVSQRLLDS